MNKGELIEALAAQVKLSKAATGKAVDGLVEIITAAVAKGVNVVLKGFGTFKATKRTARTGRHPRTGKALKIPATTVPKFKPGAKLKAAVSGKKASVKPAAKKPTAKKAVAKKK